MASESESVGQLEADALKRKERLIALKRKREESANDKLKSEDNKQDQALPKPNFRSYRPQDEAMHENIIPDAEPGNVEEEVLKQLEAAKTKVVIEELDLTTLAPRKPDWDLKRDVNSKLQRLERRTQRAIAELIRDRLRENQGGSSLAAAVALEGEGMSQQQDDD